jgi:ribosomal protein S18 acetylase RimI-like enzyme
MEILIRHGMPSDLSTILELYQDVAANPGGLARTRDEISANYCQGFTEKALKNGVWLVAIDPLTKRLIGSIHSYKLEPKVFSHVLSELTIAIHPDFQSKKVGKRLFLEFLDEVIINRADILRVELIARESNVNALRFYKSIGFKEEGRFLKRINSVGGGFEADIPMAWLRS